MTDGAPGATSWRYEDIALRMASVLGALLLWWAMCRFRIVSPVLLPSPGAVAAAGAEILREGYRGTSLGQDVLATLGRCLGGFAIATAVGVPLGLWMGMRDAARAAIDWIIQLLRPLPPLAYLILLILWLGTGDASKVALLTLGALPIIASATVAGVRGVRRQRLDAARTLGATEAQVFRLVVLPSALPMILIGLQIALAADFSTVVAAELMAASDGLGWMVFSASRFLRNDVIILCILLLGALGMGLAASLRLLDRRLVHWRGRE